MLHSFLCEIPAVGWIRQLRYRLGQMTLKSRLTMFTAIIPAIQPTKANGRKHPIRYVPSGIYSFAQYIVNEQTIHAVTKIISIFIDFGTPPS
ncbi:MAG: hypothetical protein ABI878_12395 [Acidobacteriota bacterium]